MKKFYESPIVEITVFDVEDVITTSAGGTGTVDTLEWTKSDVEANTATYAGQLGVNKVGHYGSYNW